MEKLKQDSVSGVVTLDTAHNHQQAVMHVEKIPILLGKIVLIIGDLLTSGAGIGVIGQEWPINPCQTKWDNFNKEVATSNILVKENGIRIKHRAGRVPYIGGGQVSNNWRPYSPQGNQVWQPQRKGVKGWRGSPQCERGNVDFGRGGQT